MLQRRASAHFSRHSQNEHQNLGHRLVKIDRYLRADLDLRERGGEAGIALQRNPVRLGGLDDFLPDRAATAGDDARRTAVVRIRVVSEPRSMVSVYVPILP